MASSLQRKVHYLLDPDHRDRGAERAIHIFIITLIILNVFIVTLETVQPLYKQYYRFFHAFDLFTVVVFSIEYLLRVWSCTVDPRYRHPIRGRLAYIFSFTAVVDLLAILPFYLPFLVNVDLRSIRILSLFRFLKLTRYLRAVRIFSTVLKEKKNELILGLILMLALIIISSTIMYYLERDVQPDTFSSIPQSMWWSVTTLTTLGYGDVVPVTLAGKVMTGISLVCAIAMFAVPAGILASGFSEAFRKVKGKPTCPHCGGALNDVS
jgi:voltage-gated potassium channel